VIVNVGLAPIMNKKQYWKLEGVQCYSYYNYEYNKTEI